MDQYAPDVSNTAWGHKYFSVFYPDKLDDYHSPTLPKVSLDKVAANPPE
jgi:5-methylcytosine-specific restriction enzyme B